MNFILIIIIFSLSCTSISNLFKKHQNDEAIYKTQKIEDGGLCKEQWKNNFLHGAAKK